MRSVSLVLTALLALTTWATTAGASEPDIVPDKFMDAKQDELKDLDLTAKNIRLTSFSSYQGSSMLLIVERKSRERRSKEKWRRIAVLKTQSGSTNPRGEVATYQLSRFLDTPIVPVAVLRWLNKEELKKVLATIEELDFSGKKKEVARLKVIDDIKVQLEEEKPRYAVALKEYVRGFKILPSAGWKGLREELKLTEHLDPKGAMPPDDPVTLVARNKKPRYTAETTYSQVARDISALVLLDALSSQYERWRGHNIHFRLKDEMGFKRDEDDRHLYKGGEARIMSLDNGASFARGQRRSYDVLDRYVGRFDKNVVKNLYRLYDWVYEKPNTARRWFGLNKPAFWRFRVSIARVIAGIDAKRARHGDRAIFERVRK